MSCGRSKGWIVAASVGVGVEALKDQGVCRCRGIFEDCHMSSSSIAWTVAASVGVVETLKDQGLCRWNSAFKSAQQHLKSHARSLSLANNTKLSSAMVISCRLNEEKEKLQSEESLRTVMYLSCWGPN
ncbi:hypothetical protein RJT34_28873 [Clitoria ternatea]|uniref:Wound-responsive family protein n=1 Tax=Clitoria ternatea TaxID=43366 RepID=A0AAN9FBI8_CLITE